MKLSRIVGNLIAKNKKNKKKKTKKTKKKKKKKQKKKKKNKQTIMKIKFRDDTIKTYFYVKFPHIDSVSINVKIELLLIMFVAASTKMWFTIILEASV